MVLIEVGQHIVDYVSQRVCGGINIGEAVGIGVSRDEVILGGVAFYNWNYKNIFMHAASDDENNYHARQFNERIGFTEEARMKNACLGGDILIYAMHRDQCRWIR
jgi:hypothetical protein